MKKLLLILVLFCSIGYGQNWPKTDTIRFHKLYYWGIYNKVLHYPVLISWWDTKASIKCADRLPRKDQFHNDSIVKEANNLRDYLNSGFSKGHNKSAQDSECEGKDGERECFSMVNMAMQYQAMNEGSYYHLEQITRNIAGVVDSVHVWSGSLGVLKIIGNTAAPLRQWKVLYIVAQKTYRGFIFNNTIDDSTNGKNGTEVPVKTIEVLTGFTFK